MPAKFWFWSTKSRSSLISILPFFGYMDSFWFGRIRAPAKLSISDEPYPAPEFDEQRSLLSGCLFSLHWTNSYWLTSGTFKSIATSGSNFISVLISGFTSDCLPAHYSTSLWPFRCKTPSRSFFLTTFFAVQLVSLPTIFWSPSIADPNSHGLSGLTYENFAMD